VHLSSLTDDQIQATLEGYVQYKIDYMKNDLKINPHNLKKIGKPLMENWYWFGILNSMSGQRRPIKLSLHKLIF